MDDEAWHWLAVTQDGRYFILDPASLEGDGSFREFVRRLEAQQIPGWLATTDQPPDSERALTLNLICKLTECEGDWKAASAAFARERGRSLVSS
ncbi:hypothetical protein [Lichenicoccus roseus]|uniref:Uncharacterized protein n=1 Tax=Lichenicoccus roseus TaxID=2683649 RepID=A0A5R9IZG5_9PROT|nr:hypothetical protein [Lichenicoccus roseus]TLU70845.1 hypothetical protein FE263_19870 [Lichenicoccus roseus]